MSHLAFQPPGPRVELDVDYVVVGSGAGGSPAAITLARAGLRVAVIEAGPWRDPEDYPHSMYGTMRDMFADFGQQVATGDSIIPVVQAKVVGGTTLINSAIVVRTPDDVLRDWDERLGLGDSFGARAIGEAQDQIEHELLVRPTEDPIVGTTAKLMIGAMGRAGLEVHKTDRNVAHCKGSMHCLQGCKNRAKQTANIVWLRELVDRRQGHVLSCAPASRVLIAQGRAVGVEGEFRHPQSRAKGASYVVRAKRGVLVAASAIGTVPLLLRSGYRHPYLGHGWRGHPGAGILGLYPEAVDMHVGPSQGAASVHHRLDIGIKTEHLSLPLELIAARFSGAGQALMAKLAEYRHAAMWVTAVRADAVGRISRGLFGQTQLTYVPTQADLRRVREGTKLLARMHFDAGARKVWPGIAGLPAELTPDDLGKLDDAPLDNKAWTWVVTHLFGGAVAGKDPASSVVAPDLHVRGVRDLHVVDASVIPTTLGVNPQHTIMAMAMVTAQRLAGA
jgi:choline dehydrogenase-like flavoprotein